MNKLFRIGFDTLLTSVTPILGWFLIGIIVDKDLINIFSLMYPLQFIINTILSVFGTGANVSAVKDKNKNSPFSGFVIGTIVGIIILGFIGINIDKYILFMNMDIEKYKIFAIYTVIQSFLILLFSLARSRLYYEEKNKLANKYTLLFNLINFTSIISISLITKKYMIIVTFTLITTSIYTIYMLFKTIKFTPINLNIKNCIKYDSVTLFGEISMFIIYLFGFKNSFNFGEKYILAISYVTLITDTQWDIAGAIKTSAQIDISKKSFSYKEHIKNSYKLTYLLILSTIIMGILLYQFYKTDIFVTIVVTIVELGTLYIYPMYITNLIYLQLEYSAVKATITKQIANILRTICSFIPTPFCTSIGLAVSALYQFLGSEYIIEKHKIIIKKT